MARHNFRELEIWKRGMDLVKSIFLITEDFPQSEWFGLRSQIRRSAVSIPSNIAEGSAALSQKSFHRYLSISLGSCFELETQLLISIELKFLEKENAASILEELHTIQKMIQGFQKHIRNTP